MRLFCFLLLGLSAVFAAHTPLRPAHPPTRGHFEFGVQPLYYPSFQLLSKAFRRVALAQGAYVIAVATVGDTHDSANRQFTEYFRQARGFRDAAIVWHNGDPDPFRKGWMTIRFGILNAELRLMASQAAHLPPPNPVVRGVVKAAEVTKDAIIAAGKAAAKLAVGVAYVVAVAVGAVALFVYKSLEYAANVVVKVGKGILKFLKAALRYFPVQWVPEGEESMKVRFNHLQHEVDTHYHGNWAMATPLLLRDSAGFSFRQSAAISDRANAELRAMYEALTPEERARAAATGLYRPGVHTEWSSEVAAAEHGIMNPGHHGMPHGPGVGHPRLSSSSSSF